MWTSQCEENFFQLRLLKRFDVRTMIVTFKNILFNLSSHHHSYILEYLIITRDAWFENLRETTVLSCEMFTSRGSKTSLTLGQGDDKNLIGRGGGVTVLISIQASRVSVSFVGRRALWDRK